MTKALTSFVSLLLLAGCATSDPVGMGGGGQSTGGAGGTGGSGGMSGCVPNHDGKVVASELLPVFDVDANYFVSSASVPVNLAGTSESGTLTWDFSQAFAGAEKTLQANRITGQWFEAEFPGGQWTSAFDDTTLAIYSNDENGIYLHGLASKDAPAAGEKAKTLFVYESKVIAYQFPLAVGSTWVSMGKVPAKGYMWNGLLHSGTHTYTVEVDGAGKLVLPNATTLEDVLRIRTTVLLHPTSGADATTRQTGFVYECLGEIVRATSAVNEPNDDFDPAAQLRRLVF